MKNTLELIAKIRGTLIIVFFLLLSLFFVLLISVNDRPMQTEGPLLEFRSFDPQEQLILQEETRGLPLGKALEYLPDAGNRLHLEDVLSPQNNSRFIPLWEEGNSSKLFPYYDGIGEEVQALWVRITVKEVFHNEPVLLTTPFNSTIVSAYIPDTSGGFRKTYRRIEEKWRYFSNDPEIYILLPSYLEKDTSLYIKMETRFKRRINLDFTAIKYRDYTNDFTQKNHTKGIFVGFFLAILIFHIFLYISTQEEKYYYYILFMFFLMINRMITTNINLWKYWAGMYQLENIVYSFGLAGLQICGIHFIRKTLISRYDTRKVIILNRISNRLYGFYILWALALGIMNIPFLYRQITIVICLFINMVIVYQYILFAMVKGNRAAIHYFLAFTPFFLFEILYILANPLYQSLQALIPFVRIRYLADFIQCTILASAVGQDIVRYKMEKDISGQILRDRLLNENRYLEKEVEERTRDLKEAIAIAEFANKAKSRFLANISHELRTPLGGIIGFAELINRTEEREVQHQYNQKILAESEHLLNLISDVLNLSRIESGSYEIESSPFNLKEKVNESLAGQIMLIREKGLSFHLEFAEDLPEIVIGDHHRLRQVLLNLTNNAQKFTMKGSVRVSVRPEIPEADGMSLIRFEIQDTGLGISKQKAEMIFQPFYQIDHSISRHHDGTGLGTTISKKLVELMGGDIGYSPNTPQGSIFWFALPLAIGSRKSLRTKDHREPINGSGRILIIDDYQTNREITSTHLQSLGYTTVVAEDGYKAISLCNREQFDLLLMDVHMPMLNGYETVEKIAKKCPMNESTPVLMLTAGGFDDESKDMISGNIKGIIYKPVQLNEISIRIAGILNPGSLNRFIEPYVPEEMKNLESFLEQFEDRKDGEEIIRGFLTNCRKETCSLEEHARKNEFKTLHRTVHSIKGGALNLGFTDLANSTKEFEQFIKEKDFFSSGLREEEEHILNQKIDELKGLVSQISSQGFPEG